MEESREDRTVVFALFVMKSAIEFMCVDGERVVAEPPPPPPY
jgi:hypothetical protein